MRNNRLSQLIAFMLSLLMLVSCIVPIAAADAPAEEADASSSLGTTTLKEISETLNAISYAEYKERHPDAARGTKEISIDVTKYNAEMTTAVVERRASAADALGVSKSNVLYVGDTGKVTWDVDIPQTGLYAVEIVYCAESDKTNSIERMFYINDKVPFREARYLLLTKTWIHHYDEETGRFAFDFLGNELRPITTNRKTWTTYSFVDSNGYYSDPFEFYFEKGRNTIALEAVREDCVIASIRLYPYTDLPKYQEVLTDYAQKGYREGTDTVYIAAEMPSAVSQYTLYPVYDRSSAITEPQHPTLIYLNTIGSGGSSGSNKWSTVGEWIEWEFDIENAGIYNIVPRFRQSELNGLYTSRHLTIDGKTPFEEAYYIRFGYNTDWQVAALTDGSGEPLQFYLDAGHHTMRMQVTLGDMGDIVRRVSESLDSINESYLEILKLTGSSPDYYRDYGFTRVMPDTIENMIVESINLREIIDYLETMNGVKSQYSATLEQVAILLEKMGTDEDEIARNLTNLKNYVGTMGTWVSNVSKQPLEIDYILVQGASGTLPKAKAGFFKNFAHQIKMFVGSFFTDYNSLGGEAADEGMDSVTAWVVTGRDQARIQRTLIDNNFTPYSNVFVNLKLVAGGTLLPSVLAGVGPDVALDGADPIQYAIRGAVLPLNDFNTFDEVVARFTPAAMIPITLYGKTYALPETQTFSMMFYRKDILADLGLEVPKTWDDLMAMVPVLQFNNMVIGLPNNYQLFLYQMGGELWADDGMRINLDSNTALEAFEDMCNMFTQYSLPYSYSFANRFKTGEMPIGIVTYTEYNQLILFATEIAGMWEMAPLPGIMDENGNINNCSMSGVGAIVMLNGVKNPEASWKFMDWWVSRDFQVNYANELVAVLGPAGKNATANIEALEELPWSSEEYRNLSTQMKNLAAITAYPGSYIIGRYTNFAFLNAYNNHADPVDSLLNYINTINKEINRKRKEFDYETLEIGQNLAQKRMGQAEELMANLSGYDALVAAAREAIKNSSIEGLEASAAAFGAAGTSEELGQISSYLSEAAAALRSYQQ